MCSVMNRFRWILEVIKRSDNISGFVILPKHWIVERTLDWLNWNLLAESQPPALCHEREWPHCTVTFLASEPWTSSLYSITRLLLKSAIANLAPLTVLYWVDYGLGEGKRFSARQTADRARWDYGQ